MQQADSLLFLFCRTDRKLDELINVDREELWIYDNAFTRNVFLKQEFNFR